MKKDLHDLIFMVWINETKAMIMRDEPGGTHHYEQLNNELGNVYAWVRAIAHKIRYAECVHILGPNDAMTNDLMTREASLPHYFSIFPTQQFCHHAFL